MEHLTERFRFLTEEFGYTARGAVQVTTLDVEVRAYINPAAGRQIEVSGHPIGHSLHGLIRQLIDGEPASYSDKSKWLAFWEITLVRAPEQRDSIDHNMAGWHSAVDGTAALLRNNPDLLTGGGWIALERLYEVKRKCGFPPDDEPSILTLVKAQFAFLADLGYELIFDTDRLSPHEYLAGDELRYRNGARHIRIRRADFRDGGAFSIELNGQKFGGEFSWLPEDIAARSEQLKRRLLET